MIAFYLGYPDDVLYDPVGNHPVTLYARNRVEAAEAIWTSES
jgi:hypothetical protein